MLSRESIATTIMPEFDGSRRETTTVIEVVACFLFRTMAHKIDETSRKRIHAVDSGATRRDKKITPRIIRIQSGLLLLLGAGIVRGALVEIVPVGHVGRVRPPVGEHPGPPGDAPCLLERVQDGVGEGTTFGIGRRAAPRQVLFELGHCGRDMRSKKDEGKTQE